MFSLTPPSVPRLLGVDLNLLGEDGPLWRLRGRADAEAGEHLVKLLERKRRGVAFSNFFMLRPWKAERI